LNTKLITNLAADLGPVLAVLLVYFNILKNLYHDERSPPCYLNHVDVSIEKIINVTGFSAGIRQLCSDENYPLNLINEW